MAEYLRDTLRIMQAGTPQAFPPPAGVTGTRAALYNAFMAVDADMQNPAYRVPRDSVLTEGATAAFVHVRQSEDGKRFLYAANVGDVEAVLGRRGATQVLTTKHSLQTAEGRAEAAANGGVISNVRGEYVLNETGRFLRAFGQGRHKPFGGQRGCMAAPSMTSVEIDADCDFVVIASEGFWQHIVHERAVAMGELFWRVRAVPPLAPQTHRSPTSVNHSLRNGG